MDPRERRLLQDCVQKYNPDTINDLLRCLVRKRIFAPGFVDRHREEIHEIFEECRSDVDTSSSDSDVDGREHYARSTRRRAKVLELYGPVDNRVSINIARHDKMHTILPFPHSKHLGLTGPVPQVTPGIVALFKPQSANFCFATSRHSEGGMSFIQSRIVGANELKPESDGTVKINYRHTSRGADDFEDRDDQTARYTWCIVLSDEEVKRLGMKVDIVFGTDRSKLLHEQRYHMPPPPWAPTPRESEPSLFHQAALALRSNDSLSIPNRQYSSQYHPLPSPPERLQYYSSLDRWEEPPRHHHHSHRQDLYQYTGTVIAGGSYGQPDWRSKSQSRRRNPQSSTSRSSSRRKRQRRKADVRNRGLAGLGSRVSSIADDILEWIDRYLSRFL